MASPTYGSVIDWIAAKVMIRDKSNVKNVNNKKKKKRKGR